jgi:magnesium-dependent phosphatase 1
MLSSSFSPSSLDYSGMILPKLIAFDLDGTIWLPEMYQLWGGGAPFHAHANGKDLIDSKGTTVRLLGVTEHILAEIHDNEHFNQTKLAWVSCTDEPEWADECLRKFKTSKGHILHGITDSFEIYHSNKQTHFKNLQKKYPQISFEEMLFFDNESGNIRSVSALGVKSIYCPDGVTKDIWENGLKQFHDHHNSKKK